MWYLTFSVWLTSVSIIISKSIHVAAYGIISFFIWLKIPLYIYIYLSIYRSTLLWVSLVTPMVKNLPVMWETQAWSLGQEDPLEKGTAIHSSILAWRIPWIEEPSEIQSVGSQTVRQDWATDTFKAITSSLSIKIIFFWGKNVAFFPQMERGVYHQRQLILLVILPLTLFLQT